MAKVGGPVECCFDAMQVRRQRIRRSWWTTWVSFSAEVVLAAKFVGVCRWKRGAALRPFRKELRKENLASPRLSFIGC